MHKPCVDTRVFMCVCGTFRRSLSGTLRSKTQDQDKGRAENVPGTQAPGGSWGSAALRNPAYQEPRSLRTPRLPTQSPPQGEPISGWLSDPRAMASGSQP